MSTDPATFAWWCEQVRSLHGLSPTRQLETLSSLTGSPSDPDLAWLLALRRAALGERGALEDLEPDGSLLAGSGRVAILAGGAGSMSDPTIALLEALLARALDAYAGAVVSGGTEAGLPGAVGRVGRSLGLRTVGYAPEGRGDQRLYAHVRETPASPRFTVRESLAMWTEILRAGLSPADVRVVICPGGPLTALELLLARALQARIGWLVPDARVAGAGSPDDERLALDGGMVDLGSDAVALERFLLD